MPIVVLTHVLVLTDEYAMQLILYCQVEKTITFYLHAKRRYCLRLLLFKCYAKILVY